MLVKEAREMNDNTSTHFAKLELRAPRIETGALNPAAAVPKAADKTHGRHAAITNKLNSWSSYKNWVQEIRTTWHENK